MLRNSIKLFNSGKIATKTNIFDCSLVKRAQIDEHSKILVPNFALPDSNRRHFSTSCSRWKVNREDRKVMLASMPKEDQGTEGERGFYLDSTVYGASDLFPDPDLPDRHFQGIRFAEIPVCHVKTTPNNTIISITDSEGRIYFKRSCGMEGFKNTRKGTNVAAQATGISTALKAIEIGVKQVRVKISGLGPGRMSSVKGLTMGGLNIVSVTDDTWINWTNNPRPKKRRRL
ncbi:small ribosomal subunit protein uS11m-like [Artemia franciscana]|uniref:small ribosomal subunit protein uS11m-like n=1 Tax=Artemia franciscana TaxID=6661 RepID=UPI0032DBC1CD